MRTAPPATKFSALVMSGSAWGVEEPALPVRRNPFLAEHRVHPGRLQKPRLVAEKEVHGLDRDPRGRRDGGHCCRVVAGLGDQAMRGLEHLLAAGTRLGPPGATSLHRSPELRAQRMPPAALVIGFVTRIAQAFGIAAIAAFAGVSGPASGALTGAAVFVVIVLPLMIGEAAFGPPSGSWPQLGVAAPEAVVDFAILGAVGVLGR
jgi:hypothetical protein